MENKKKQKFMLEKHKDIARIDQETKRTHGWYVRVRFRGRRTLNFFPTENAEGVIPASCLRFPGEIPQKKNLARYVPTSILSRSAIPVQG